jgi:hypothetical protein
LPVSTETNSVLMSIPLRSGSVQVRVGVNPPVLTTKLVTRGINCTNGIVFDRTGPAVLAPFAAVILQAPVNEALYGRLAPYWLGRGMDAAVERVRARPAGAVLFVDLGVGVSRRWPPEPATY